MSEEACTKWFVSAYDRQLASAQKTTKQAEIVLAFHCSNTRDPAALLERVQSVIKAAKLDFSAVYFTAPKIDQLSRADDSNVSVSVPDRNTSWQEQMKKVWVQQKNEELHVMPTVNALVRALEERTKTNNVHVFITGSFYLVGGVLEVVGF